MIHHDSEKIFSYGNAFHGVFVSKMAIVSIAIRGLIPECWRKNEPYKSEAYDCVCLTVIPEGKTMHNRFMHMTQFNDFVNKFHTKMTAGIMRPDHILIGLVVDLPQASQLPFVEQVKAFGHCPDQLYPTSTIAGLESESFYQAKIKGQDDGLTGEIRVYFSDDQTTVGLVPNVWRGIVTRTEDVDTLHDWINELQPLVDLTQIPIFDEKLQLTK